MGKKILWLSDSPGTTTGYATISRKLLNYLTEMGWESHFLGHINQHQTYIPGTTLEDGEVLNFYQHGAGIAPYCADIIVPKIREIRPDIFGILLDSFMVHPNNHGGNPWFLNLDFAPAKSLFYFPSDGENFPLGCDAVLRKVDKAVAMAKFGQKQVKENYNMDVDYIPHAIEPDNYKPLTDQEKFNLRLKYSQRFGIDLRDKFVVGTVARAQGRKMLDRTLKSFALAAKDIPNAVLMLHCDKFDPANYFNFDVEISKLLIQNRVVFTGTKYHRGYHYKEMNEIYNLMDVFFLSTSGEGFGIPTVEAMSCEVPVLVTNYTTTAELVTDHKSGEAIKLAGEILGNWHVERGIMDIADGAEKIVKLYKDPNLRKEYGKNGREAVLKNYNWKEVAKIWNAYLLKMIGE